LSFLSPFCVIYGVNEHKKGHKKGQFEPAGLGKLFAKHFSIWPEGMDWKDFQSCFSMEKRNKNWFVKIQFILWLCLIN
jgi:hypothetical protein